MIWLRALGNSTDNCSIVAENPEKASQATRKEDLILTLRSRVLFRLASLIWKSLSNPYGSQAVGFLPTPNKKTAKAVFFMCAGKDSNLRSPMGDRFTVCCD